jgi:hypothetical protein
MDRSTYPQLVQVMQTHLVNTEETKDLHIRQRFRDTSSLGVTTGLDVTINANPTRLNIAAGSGYVPNGEWIEVTASQAAIALADYTLDVDNYVYLIYTEVQDRPEAHAFGGTTAPTRATRSFRVAVYTLAQYTALPATDPDLTKDAKDRALLVCKARAQGENVALTTGNLTVPDVRPRIISLTQLTTIPGIEIIGVDPSTPTTAEALAAGFTTPNHQATFVYTYIASPFSATLKYRAPGDTTGGDSGFGSPVTISNPGAPFTLLSNNGKYVFVGRALSMLMMSGTLITTESVDSIEMYAEAVVRTSARDELHRRRSGSTLPQNRNAHGTSMKDLGNTHESTHTLFLGTLLQSTVGQALVPRIVAQMSTFGTRTYLFEIPLASSTRKIRFYVNAFRTLDITVNARWFTDAAGTTNQWIKDDTVEAASKFSISDGSFSCFGRTASDPSNWDDATWTSIPLFVTHLAGIDSKGVANINGQAIFGGSILATAAQLLGARAFADYAATGVNVRTLLFASQITGGGTPGSYLRIYRSNSSSVAMTHTLEFVFNAAWDGTQWVKDSLAAASKLQIGFSGFAFFQRAAGGAAFTDVADPTGWDQTYSTATPTLLASTGNIQAAGAAGVSEFTYVSARTWRMSISAADFEPIANAGITSPTTPVVHKLAAGNGSVVVPLRLPHGATLVSPVVVFGKMTAGGGNNTALVKRFRRTSGASVTVDNLYSGGATTFADSGGNFVDNNVPVDQNLVIDNTAYSYMLTFESNGGTADFDIGSVYLTFTTTAVVL